MNKKTPIIILSFLIIVFIVVWFGYTIPETKKVIHEASVRQALKLVHAGVELDQEGKGQQALELFNQALEFDPTCTVAYYNMGTVEMKMGNYDHAIGHFSKAIALNPQYSAAIASRDMATRLKNSKGAS